MLYVNHALLFTVSTFTSQCLLVAISQLGSWILPHKLILQHIHYLLCLSYSKSNHFKMYVRYSLLFNGLKPSKTPFSFSLMYAFSFANVFQAEFTPDELYSRKRQLNLDVC